MLGIVINVLIAATAVLVITSLWHSVRRFTAAWQALQAQMISFDQPVQVRVYFKDASAPSGPRGGAQVLRPRFGQAQTTNGAMDDTAQRAAA